MSSPRPEDPQQEAQRWLRNATKLDAAQQYVEADECYSKGIILLREAVRSPAMPPEEKQRLMNYMSDVAKRMQAIREHIRTRNSQPATPLPQQHKQQPLPARVKPTTKKVPKPPPPQEQPPAAAATGVEDDDYLSFLDDPKYKKAIRATAAGAAVASPPSSSSSPAPSPPPLPPSREGKLPLPPPPSDFLAMPDMGPAAASAAAPLSISSAMASVDGPVPAPNAALRNHFAPRTSDLVLKAIDVAQELTRRGELKRAVDVLQHAFKVGGRERNTPSNFAAIKDMLLFMRRRYYIENPPRFLQDNPLLPAEMAVLRKSGITSTILLPMWDDVGEGYGAENVFMPCEATWTDSFTPGLAKKQQQRAAKWVSLGDLAKGHFEDLSILGAADPLQICQSVVGDCTVVCALIICANFQKRFPKARILSHAIYPHDKDGDSMVNTKGKYCVKMLINGMTRMVTIDDRVPVDGRTGKLLCTHATDTMHELWVPLMEKAFIKVNGGSYEFPGSDTCADLYKMAGWLPERSYPQDDDADTELLWNRLATSLRVGAVLLSVSTAAHTDDRAAARRLEAAKLATGHAYAVLDLRELEVGGRTLRVVQMRNPWGSPSWGGTLSSADTSPAAKEVHREFGFTAEMADLGVFLMLWEDVCDFFQRISANWNPYMLYRTADGLPRRPTRLACHGTMRHCDCYGEAAQIHIGVVASPKTTRMHLVFTRHISDVKDFSEELLAESKDRCMVAMGVYDVSKAPSVAQCIGGRCVAGMCYCRRLFSRTDLIERMAPLNDEVYRQTAIFTTSFDCSPGTSSLLVVLRRDRGDTTRPFNFTLTLHSELEQMLLRSSDTLVMTESLDDFNGQLQATNAGRGNPDRGVFMHLVPRTALKHASTINGAWVKGKSCGGRNDSATLVYNPQYKLTLKKPALVFASLATPDSGSASCELVLCNKRADKRGPAVGGKPLSFAARVGNISSDIDFLMSAPIYGRGGAIVDSALPKTLSEDILKILGPLPRRTPRRILVNVAGATSPTLAGTALTLYDVADGDEVSSIAINALTKNFPVSLSSAVIAVAGVEVPLTVTIADLFTVAAGGNAGAGAKMSHIEVGLVAGTSRAVAAAMPLAPKSPEDVVFESIKTVLADLECRSTQARRSELQLRSCIRRVESKKDLANAPAAVREYLLDLCAAGVRLARREQDRAAAAAHSTNTTATATSGQPLQCLPPLPAGEYTLIASQWDAGSPGRFVLTVETTEAHTVSEIAEEGDGLTGQTVTARLLRGGAALPGASSPPASLPKSHPYFLNSKTSVQLAGGGGAFVCRLFLLPDKAGTKPTARVTLCIFAVRDAVTMELVAASGSCTNRGVAVGPIALEGGKQYLLITSSSEPSTDAYALRIFSASQCAAHLVQ